MPTCPFRDTLYPVEVPNHAIHGLAERSALEGGESLFAREFAMDGGGELYCSNGTGREATAYVERGTGDLHTTDTPMHGA